MKSITIYIDGEQITILPLRGRKARMGVPIIMDYLLGFFKAIDAKGIDLIQLITNPEATGITFSQLIAAADEVLGYFHGTWEQVETTLLPLVFSVDKEWENEHGNIETWLEEHGTPGEVIKAFIQALLFHTETSFNLPSVAQALKNLTAMGEVPTEDTSQTTSPITEQSS